MGGYPIPGPGGVPHPALMDGTPLQVWTGGTSSQVWRGGYPIPGPGGLPIQLMGVPHPRSKEGTPSSTDGGTPSQVWTEGVPHPRCGMGYPPGQEWVGYPLARTGWSTLPPARTRWSAPMTRTGWGTPSPPPH